MTTQPREKIMMTAEEYRKLPETTERIELINGELIMYGSDEMPSPTLSHQQTISFIFAFLLRFFTPDKIFSAPTDIYIDDINYVQPDLFVITANNQQEHVGKDGKLYGAPDLIIEILSPSTAHRDEGKKYDLYEQYGVHEYWIVDPVLKLVKVFTRKDEGFARVGVFGVEQTFVSPILNAQTVEVKLLFPQQ